MARVFSGIQPSGEMTLGAYLGALRRFAMSQDEDTSYFCIVDLHALTVAQEPAELRERILRQAALYLAVGIDPDLSTIFVQSHVHEHTELAWLIECNAAFGELNRMTQFKEKSDRQRDFISAALFTYPALMAADILLYDTDEVPVGDDQRQHLELTRDVAQRFNARYGETFVVPSAAIPKVGARIMDLQTPEDKMSKSVESQGTVFMLDSPADIERKFKRAVTDNDAEVRFDRAEKPGVSNLLEILAVCTGEDPDKLASTYSQYGPLKADTADAVIELLAPVQTRFAELVGDPAELRRTLAAGAAKAQAYASVTLAKAQRAVGLR